MVFTVWKQLEMAGEDVAIETVINILKNRLHPISGTQPIDSKCIINKLKGKALTQDDYIELIDAAEKGVKYAPTDDDSIIVQWARLEQFLRCFPINNVRHTRNDPRNRQVVRRTWDRAVG